MFENSDYSGWAGAEEWSDGSQPWIIDEMDFKGDISDDLEIGRGDYLENFGQYTQFVVSVADSQGIGIYFMGRRGEQGPMFHQNARMSPEEAEGALEDISRDLRTGRLPRGFRHTN